MVIIYGNYKKVYEIWQTNGNGSQIKLPIKKNRTRHAKQYATVIIYGTSIPISYRISTVCYLILIFCGLFCLSADLSMKLFYIEWFWCSIFHLIWFFDELMFFDWLTGICGVWFWGSFFKFKCHYFKSGAVDGKVQISNSWKLCQFKEGSITRKSSSESCVEILYAGLPGVFWGACQIEAKTSAIIWIGKVNKSYESKSRQII